MTQEEVMSHEGHMVAEFIRTFKASLDLRLWVKLMREELKEFNESVYDSENALKEIADLLYVRTGFILVVVSERVLSLRKKSKSGKICCTLSVTLLY
jgi:hypothetical protein